MKKQYVECLSESDQVRRFFEMPRALQGGIPWSKSRLRVLESAKQETPQGFRADLMCLPARPSPGMPHGTRRGTGGKLGAPAGGWRRV
jgi:hypothetical protein